MLAPLFTNLEWEIKKVAYILLGGSLIQGKRFFNKADKKWIRCETKWLRRNYQQEDGNLDRSSNHFRSNNRVHTSLRYAVNLFGSCASTVLQHKFSQQQPFAPAWKPYYYFYYYPSIVKPIGVSHKKKKHWSWTHPYVHPAIRTIWTKHTCAEFSWSESTQGNVIGSKERMRFRAVKVS